MNAITQHIHEALRQEAVHAADHFALTVDDDSGRNGGDAQHPGKPVFKINLLQVGMSSGATACALFVGVDRQ